MDMVGRPQLKNIWLEFKNLTTKARNLTDILFDVIEIFRNAKLLVQVADIDGRKFSTDPRLNRVYVVRPSGKWEMVSRKYFITPEPPTKFIALSIRRHRHKQMLSVALWLAVASHVISFYQLQYLIKASRCYAKNYLGHRLLILTSHFGLLTCWRHLLTSWFRSEALPEVPGRSLGTSEARCSTFLSGCEVQSAQSWSGLGLSPLPYLRMLQRSVCRSIRSLRRSLPTWASSRSAASSWQPWPCLEMPWKRI